MQHHDKQCRASASLPQVANCFMYSEATTRARALMAIFMPLISLSMSEEEREVNTRVREDGDMASLHISYSSTLGKLNSTIFYILWVLMLLFIDSICAHADAPHHITLHTNHKNIPSINCMIKSTSLCLNIFSRFVWVTKKLISYPWRKRINVRHDKYIHKLMQQCRTHTWIALRLIITKCSALCIKKFVHLRHNISSISSLKVSQIRQNKLEKIKYPPLV